MVKSKYVLIVTIVLLARLTSLAQSQTVEMPGTQLLKINSVVVGQEYNLLVHLPGNYAKTDKQFPVVYLLDAQWDFPLVTAIYGQQYYDGFLPEVIIVGITWGGENPNHDNLRGRDLTPTNMERMPQSGNGPKFLDFIQRELIPKIESEFRATTDRTLIGSSLGGLFTLYALFDRPQLFNRYVLTSPALGWDREIIYRYEKKYYEKKSAFPARLFMGIGDLEGTEGFQKFTELLKGRNYKNFELQTRVLENTGHSGSKAEGYTRGLQAVFAKPSIKVPTEILDRHAGTYQLSGDAKIKIIRDKDQLVLQFADNSRHMLAAETENDFYVKGQRLSLHFKTSDGGEVSGVLIERFFGDAFAKKVLE